MDCWKNELTVALLDLRKSRQRSSCSWLEFLVALALHQCCLEITREMSKCCKVIDGVWLVIVF
jgi:hypothetical protein